MGIVFYCLKNCKACEILIFSSHIIAENDDREGRCGWGFAKRNRDSVMPPWIRGQAIPDRMVQPTRF